MLRQPRGRSLSGQLRNKITAKSLVYKSYAQGPMHPLISTDILTTAYRTFVSESGPNCPLARYVEKEFVKRGIPENTYKQ